MIRREEGIRYKGRTSGRLEAVGDQTARDSIASPCHGWSDNGFPERENKHWNDVRGGYQGMKLERLDESVMQVVEAFGPVSSPCVATAEERGR